VAWVDARSGNPDIYAQRVNASGVMQWTVDGVALCAAANDQLTPQIISDGAGGAIVTWYDVRSGTNYDIYAQRISASGVVQWTANGVALCTAANDQSYPTVISDGAGGAIVTWHDLRSGTSYDIYAQRINASGVVQWIADGVALCVATNNQWYPMITTDGAGGAIVTWHDLRSGTNYDVYAQRINASGVVQWTTNGVALCTVANDQSYPTGISDGAGGAIVTWQDLRSGTSYDIYAQRINASGVVQWVANGVALCILPGNQYGPKIVPGDAGGAIVTWQDYRSGTSYDIYGQRITTSGATQWVANGVALCTVTGDQTNPMIGADGGGGAIVAWADTRGVTTPRVYAQRINASGVVQWAGDGVALTTVAGGQYPTAVVSDGAGGAIVSWSDYRSGISDVYAQRVEGHYGYWGQPEPVLTTVADIPKDQGGKVAVNWEASGRDLPVPRTISHYTIWRALDLVSASESGNAPRALADLNHVGADATGPVFISTPPTANGPGYYWELVGTQAAHGWPGYSFSAPTRADSVAGNTGTEYFMVAAHDQYDDYIAFSSNVVSGHSVDNLAPAAPLYLTAQRVGADVNLKWNRVRIPDLKDYSVYRATSSGVTPVPVNLLASATDSLLVDPGAPATALYYIVTAKDVHANQSTPSNEASVSALTGVGNTPSITHLTVLANHPNPFNATTEFEVGLPVASDIDVEIYDVAGRRVSTLEVKQAGAGWQHIPFSGLDSKGSALASGVYFYRVHAAGTTVTRKMVIAR
jgi:hypothetical protein